MNTPPETTPSSQNPTPSPTAPENPASSPVYIPVQPVVYTAYHPVTFVSPQPIQPVYVTAPANPDAKERIAYMLLAIFLGCFGVHNFYAGYTGRGAAQLCITIFSLGLLCFVPAIWALIEAFTVMKDAHGIPFTK